MEIPTITLKGGISIPQIGLGTWQLKDESCTRSVAHALELGYRHIDTAEIYGNESEVGEAIQTSGVARGDIFITSKAWLEHAGHESMRAAVLGSLERLQTSYLDLYLIHWPTDTVPIEETIGTLAELRDQGLIRAFGVSNYGPENLTRAVDTSEHVAVNQVEFHPFLYQKELLALCKQHDIVLTAYSPIARGAVRGNAVLKRIGEAHGKSEVQVTLRWLLDKGIVVIPKASSRPHLEANLDLDFTLSKQETAAIDDLNEDKRFVDPGFADWS
jgi:2,5-diketo-D-gluconate reductase B